MNLGPTSLSGQPHASVCAALPGHKVGMEDLIQKEAEGSQDGVMVLEFDLEDPGSIPHSAVRLPG